MLTLRSFSVEPIMYAQLIAVSKNLHAFLINKSIIFLEFSVTLNIALFDNTLNNCSAKIFMRQQNTSQIRS
jgi:hypothetical protein